MQYDEEEVFSDKECYYGLQCAKQEVFLDKECNVIKKQKNINGSFQELS